MKKVSVIIVNWNGLHHLKKCLPSLFKSTYPIHDVIVVDNASTDGSREYITELTLKNRNLKLVKSDINNGFAKGNNIGYKFAKGEYILFLNNDTVVRRDFLEPLVKELNDHEEYGAVQSKILWMGHPERLDSVGAFLTYTGFLYHFGYLQKDTRFFDKKIPLYTAKGACMMFKKKVIDEIGLFDELFFAYFEETDLCHRLWIGGHKIYYVPESIIYHHIGGTSNNMNNAFIQYHSFKNRINSYIKNLELRSMIKILPLHLILCELISIVFLFTRGPKLSFAIQRAIIWNVIHLKHTLKLRRHIQTKIRRISDRKLAETIISNVGFRYYLHLFTNSLQNYSYKK